METTTSAVNLKTEALKNGAIWGVISIVIFLVTWYVVPDLLGGYISTGISVAIGLALAIFFCMDMRKKAGGFWSFGEALWNIFAMFLLAGLIIFVFTILFGKFIDPSYPVKMKEIAITKTESMLKSLGMGEDEIARSMEKTSESMDKQLSPTFGQAVISFGIAAIFYFIFALLFAAIFKKNRPLYVENE